MIVEKKKVMYYFFISDYVNQDAEAMMYTKHCLYSEVLPKYFTNIPNCWVLSYQAAEFYQVHLCFMINIGKWCSSVVFDYWICLITCILFWYLSSTCTEIKSCLMMNSFPFSSSVLPIEHSEQQEVYQKPTRIKMRKTK